MAFTETTVQYERDLRSAHNDLKRTRDFAAKWSNGARPVHGVQLDWATMEATGGTEEQRAKTRPRQKFSELGHHAQKDKHNIVKTNRGSYGLPAGRVRNKVSAQDEIDDASRSMIDMLPPPRHNSVSDNFLYSFDRTESPAHVLSLDVFVKQNVRETEKLVEKEYEILDTNGEALKGRKARQTLRKAMTGPIEVVEEHANTDDDDFELIWKPSPSPSPSEVGAE